MGRLLGGDRNGHDVDLGVIDGRGARSATGLVAATFEIFTSSMLEKISLLIGGARRAVKAEETGWNEEVGHKGGPRRIAAKFVVGKPEFLLEDVADVGVVKCVNPRRDNSPDSAGDVAQDRDAARREKDRAALFAARLRGE